MNNKLDIELFFKLRYNEECVNLDSNIIDSIVDTFSNNKNKKFKMLPKKPIAVLKNPTLKQMKDKITNRVNLILNKISENNIENLVVEFIENIKITSVDDYHEFIRSFYIKLLSEISFFKHYIKFFYMLTSTYSSINSEYSDEYFYNLIETKFSYDYFNEEKSEDIEYFKNMEDDKRINNLTVIEELIKIKYFNDSFTEHINNKILEQTKHFSDIYYWFKNSKLSSDQIDKINNILSDDIQLRDKVLLENLLNGCTTLEINQPVNKIIFKKPANISYSGIVADKKVESVNNKMEPVINNKMESINKVEPVTNNKVELVTNKVESVNNTELENNLEEYLFIDNSESIEDYINNNCKDANTKNKFCEFLIDKYFKLSHTESQKVLSLMRKLIKFKVLFKSNLSRGLLNIAGTKNNYNQDKFKKLLLFLKSLGITNGLETLMNKYKIELSLTI